MGTSAISHLRYDLDNYASSLQRTATLASTFFIKNQLVRMEYLKENDDYINDIYRKFSETFDINERMRLINEMRAEYELANREYQLLRQGNFTKYVITDIFEDQGIIKYAKISAGVIGGVFQVYGGIKTVEIGKAINSKSIIANGVILSANGISNTFESISPIIVENQNWGLMRKLFRYSAEKMGYDTYIGDLAYDFIDFSTTAYAAYSGLALKQNPLRLISKGFFNKPGTGRLFRFTDKDYAKKWELRSPPMNIAMMGLTAYKFKATFLDDDNERE